MNALFITHDLPLAKLCCDSIIVMCYGYIVEIVPQQIITENNKSLLHPYTYHLFFENKKIMNQFSSPIHAHLSDHVNLHKKNVKYYLHWSRFRRIIILHVIIK